MDMEDKKPLNERVEVLEDKVEKIETAFPGGDFTGHARYHAAVIEELQSRKKLREAVMEQLVKGSVWAGLVFLGTVILTYLKDHVFTVLPLVK